MKNPFSTFRFSDYALWFASLTAVCLSFFLGAGVLHCAASLIGVTALIFVAKGHVLGQILTVAFSAFYGYISYLFRYYGEMITYLGMTTPVAVAAVVSWIRHPSEENAAEVQINRLRGREYALIVAAGITVGAAFYFILRAFGTANLFFSVISVITSFIAVWLTVRRSEYYAIAYACNDVVLVVLWTLAAAVSAENWCMVVCFAAFLVNDLYGFVLWLRRKKRQSAH